MAVDVVLRRGHRIYLYYDTLLATRKQLSMDASHPSYCQHMRLWFLALVFDLSHHVDPPRVCVSMTGSPDCHSLMAVWAVANPLGLRLPPPPPSFMSARLLACLLGCLHARLPVRMLTAHMHAPMPALARTHPHLCLHARPMPTLACTHPRLRLHACNHARARMHAPTPSLACAYPR